MRRQRPGRGRGDGRGRARALRRRRRAREFGGHQRAAAAASRPCRTTTGIVSSPPTCTAPTTASRHSCPECDERQTGTIININSDAGQAARDVSGAAYVSSKFGLRGLTQQINIEERGHGVRACSICPRDINTPLLDRRLQPPSPDVRARDAPARGSCRLRVVGRDPSAPSRARRDICIESLTGPCWLNASVKAESAAEPARNDRRIKNGRAWPPGPIDDQSRSAGARVRRQLRPEHRQRLVTLDD